MIDFYYLINDYTDDKHYEIIMYLQSGNSGEDNYHKRERSRAWIAANV